MNETEVNDFKASNDIELLKIDNNVSVKTNFYTATKNFLLIQNYLRKLKAYIQYVDNLINIDSLIDAVLLRFQIAKTNLEIDQFLPSGQFINVVVGTVSYRITRIDEFNIEITNLTVNNWNTDQLIVQVKTLLGVIVYPVIQTTENKIKLYFADGIMSNYKVFFI